MSGAVLVTISIQKVTLTRKMVSYVGSQDYSCVELECRPILLVDLLLAFSADLTFGLCALERQAVSVVNIAWTSEVR